MNVRKLNFRANWPYLVAGLFTIMNLSTADENFLLGRLGAWGTVLHLAIGAAALFAMRLRHRYPLALTLALSALSVPFIELLIPCTVWAYLHLCKRRKIRLTLLGGVVMYAALILNPLYAGLGQGRDQPGIAVPDDVYSSIREWAQLFTTLTPLAAALVVMLIATLGSFLGTRQEAKMERIAALERERELLADAARAEERAELAREMHDVLAHKISLIAMHAGALAYRDDLGAEETRPVVGTIQQSATQALEELRTILGRLRQIDAEGAPARPQPTLAGLDALLAEHRVVGRQIEADVRIDGEPHDVLSRHAYRIVQECLTNAARPAPGAVVQLAIAGSPQDGLNIRAANQLSLITVASPGSGLGLVGLEERAELLGGRMSAGPKGGDFVVEVWLPW